MLTRMLRDLDKPNNLPKYNTHVVGAGGIVINPQNNQILLIKEKSIFGKYIWKIPGGQVDPGEFLHEGMAREVKEETGVTAKFLGLAALREVLNFRFGATDVYYVGILQAETFELKPQENEVVDCKWATIREFIDSTKQGVSMAAMISEVLEYLDAELSKGRKLPEVVSDADIGLSDSGTRKSPFLVAKHFEFELGKTTIRNNLYLSPRVLGASTQQKL